MNKFTKKVKDNIFLLSQIVFCMIYPAFVRGEQSKFGKELALANNLPEKTLIPYISCIKKHRGINKKTFVISQRYVELIAMMAELSIGQLEDLLYLNNSDENFDLYLHLKEENN